VLPSRLILFYLTFSLVPGTQVSPATVSCLSQRTTALRLLLLAFGFGLLAFWCRRLLEGKRNAEGKRTAEGELLKGNC
jgi:hypothetical protein